MKKKSVQIVENASNSKRNVLKTEERQSIFRTIVSNYTKGFEAIKKALDPNTEMKDSTIKYYMYTCNTWAAGRDVKGKLTSFRKIWAEYNNSKVQKPIEQKVKNKKVSNPISKNEDIKYAIINNNSILKMSDNLNWLQGYCECYSDKQSQKTDLKIFKIMELVQA